MLGQASRRTLCLVFLMAVVLLAWIAAPYVVVGMHSGAYYDVHWMWVANLLFATDHGRMPESLEELVQKRYLKPATVDGRRCYLVAGDHQISDLANVEVAWGVRTVDLIARNGRVYYKDRPNEETFLIRYTSRMLHFFDRAGEEWYTKSLYDRMMKYSH